MKKRTRIWLIVAALICLVGMLGASLVQSNFGKIDVSYHRLSLSEMISGIEANNKAYGKDVEVSFGTAGSAIVFGTATSARVEFKLLVPDGVSEKNPAPAIVLAPGMDDTKEQMYTLFTELARRGYVVAVMDKAGEGNSDLAADGYTNGSAGTEAVIEYVMSLPYVDEDRVGVSGHSNGNKFLIIAMNNINNNTRNHVSAFLMGQGTGFLFRIGETTMNDVKFGMIVGKNDEMDTLYFNSAVYDETDAGKNWIRAAYPAFEGKSVPLGQWFTAEGPQDVKPGEMLDATTARVLYNPPTTHPGMEFAKSGTAAYVDFFYGAFGVPAGHKYIPSSNQACWWMVAFSFIGMLGMLALIFPVCEVLLSIPLFAALKQKPDDAAALPSIRSWKESVPLLIMMVGLSIFGALSYFPVFTEGATQLPPTTLLPLSSNFMNQTTFWVMVMAAVTCAAVIVIYLIKKLLYGKNAQGLPVNPFACADISLRTLLRSLLFAGFLYMVMYIPVVIARMVFKVDLRLAIVQFTWYRPERVFIILRYAALFLPFYLMNAILVANTRFSDLPDWASTGIVSLGNALGVAVLEIVQYTALVNNHLLYVSNMGGASIHLWKMFLPMILGPYVCRFIYNRTKNVWIAAVFNTLFFMAAAFAMTGITTSLGLFGM